MIVTDECQINGELDKALAKGRARSGGFNFRAQNGFLAPSPKSPAKIRAVCIRGIRVGSIHAQRVEFPAPQLHGVHADEPLKRHPRSSWRRERPVACFAYGAAGKRSPSRVPSSGGRDENGFPSDTLRNGHSTAAELLAHEPDKTAFTDLKCCLRRHQHFK